MSTDTAAAVLAIGAALIAWIFNLVRGGRLYVGYGVIFGVAILTTAIVVGLPPILGAGGMWQAHVEGFVVGASAFVILILVYTLSQVTRWSNRVIALTQELAIRHADASVGSDSMPRQRAESPLTRATGGVATSSEAGSAPSGSPPAVTTANAWELAYQRFETPEQERRKCLRRLRSLGVDRWDRQASVLDICSGSGASLVAWRRLGFRHVNGVDLSPALVEASDLRRSCIIGDARQLPIRTASRDIAMIQGGLHHLPELDDVGTALAEMHRVLRPDGRVIIIEPCLTPFLRVAHFVSELPLARAMSKKIDAFAAMTDEERPTYERWLARGEPRFEALTAMFEPTLIRRRWGKVLFVGRPR